MIKNNKVLKWFLYEEFLEMIENKGLNNREDVLNKLKDQSKFYNRPLIKFLSKIFRIKYSLIKPFLNNKNKIRILFQKDTGKYSSIINKSSSNRAILMGLKSNSFKNFIFKGTIYYPIFNIFNEYLYQGVIDNDVNLIRYSLTKLERIFEYLNPDIMVLNEDATLESRAIILVCKEMGIPTVEIQHGVYDNSLIATGIYVDYVFVWGEYFKNLYLNQNIKNEKNIKILGYPYELKPIKNKPNKKKVICYIGQNFENYNRKLIKIKIKNITFLDRLCKDRGYEFLYRPHPGDDMDLIKSYYPSLKVSPGSLFDSINKGDIFISYNSTALIEAALYDKTCVQLKNYSQPTGDFENLGICKSVDTLEELESFIINSGNINDLHKSINEDYLKIPDPDPGGRFLELISEIIDNKYQFKH